MRGFAPGAEIPPPFRPKGGARKRKMGARALASRARFELLMTNRAVLLSAKSRLVGVGQEQDTDMSGSRQNGFWKVRGKCTGDAVFRDSISITSSLVALEQISTSPAHRHGFMQLPVLGGGGGRPRGGQYSQGMGRCTPGVWWGNGGCLVNVLRIQDSMVGPIPDPLCRLRLRPAPVAVHLCNSRQAIAPIVCPARFWIKIAHRGVHAPLWPKIDISVYVPGPSPPGSFIPFYPIRKDYRGLAPPVACSRWLAAYTPRPQTGI